MFHAPAPGRNRLRGDELGRGGVGEEARTRLAHAQRALDDAHEAAPRDPVRAVAASQAATSYAAQAIAKYGPWRGGRLALRRFGRCHPWGGHGYDPVP